MTNVLKRVGEKVRNAIEYISEEKQKNPTKDVKTIINSACLKYDLSPLETQFVNNFFSE